jgi:cytochrome b561
VHVTLAFILIGLIGIHVAAALYHGIVRRDGVISRMWPPFSI